MGSALIRTAVFLPCSAIVGEFAVPVHCQSCFTNGSAARNLVQVLRIAFIERNHTITVVNIMHGIVDIYGNRTNSEHKEPGMIMRDALDIVKKYGDVRKKDFPYHEETPKAIDLYERYADELYEVGRPCRISEYCRVDTVVAAKLALMSGVPLLMAMEWFEDMEVDENGILTTEYVGYAGGHCMFIYGWNEYGWKVQNSWGSDWGVNGCFILPYELGMAECWAVMDNIIEGAYIEKPFQSKVGKAFAKIVNKICNTLRGDK